MTKALGLLDHVSAEPRSLGELVTVTGLPKSTVHRLATVLVDAGFLRYDSNRYVLGYRIMELGELAKRQVRLLPVARRHMEALSAVCHETVHLGELVGTAVVYLEKVEGARGLQMRSRIGLNAPAGITAMGKALIACQPEDAWLQYFDPSLRHTPNTIVDARAFHDELRATRARGYAFDQEENELGICCLAAPIVDATGVARAAVSVSGAVIFLPPERLKALAADVVACADAISRELGGSAGPGVGRRST